MGTYNYTNVKVLHNIFNLLPYERTNFSVILKPNIPEIVNKEKRKNIDWNNGEENSKKCIEVCKANNIIPFWGIRFNFDGFNSAELDYLGPKKYIPTSDSLDLDLGPTPCITGPVNLSNNPLLFTYGNRWYQVEFRGVENQENVSKVKPTINEFIKRGYFTFHLEAKIYSPEEFILKNRKYDTIILGNDGNLIAEGSDSDLEKILLDVLEPELV